MVIGMCGYIGRTFFRIKLDVVASVNEDCAIVSIKEISNAY